MHHLGTLPTFGTDGTLTIVIETPKGSTNKLTFVPEEGYFELGAPLPLGAMFPFDFGFVPGTVGGDGDPLDVLLLLEGGVYPGVVVHGRLIGVIEAEQTERDGKRTRNDRLIAVAGKSRLHQRVASLVDLPVALLDEIEHFFASYNEIRGKRFEPLRRVGPEGALEKVREGMARVRRKKTRSRAKTRKK